MELLHDDDLANVLGRLRPRSLAASRIVCKHWCSIIDARRLLRADLLPLHLDAFFCNPSDLQSHPSFFARPSTMRRITGRLDFLDTLRDELLHLEILDHCNGLLLLWEMVVNPATRQWADLPPFPEPTMSMIMAIPAMEEEDLLPCFYLVYDPMVSPQHYEVFLFPMLLLDRSRNDGIKSSEQDLSEWPLSPYTTHVFSSRKWWWEERSFVRQGEPAGTVGDCRSDSDRWPSQCQAVYFRATLYAHCQNDSVMRVASSDDKYQMIESPAAGTKHGEHAISYLGKSEKGVYSVLLDRDDDSCPQLRVWLLNELCGQMEWVLKCNISLQAVVENFPRDFANHYSKPWIVNYNKEAPAQDGLDEWDFDNGIVLEVIDNAANKTN